jgi:hypothetical protein
MKKLVIFIGGIVCGVLILLVIQDTIQYNRSNTNDTEELVGDTFIEEVKEEDTGRESNASFTSAAEIEIPGEIIREKSFKVFQVFHQYLALVHGKDEYGGYTGTVYMLKRDMMDIATIKSPFYDEQIVNVPKGKVVRLFGTSQYPTRGGYIKTVPIIKIVDK